MTKNKKNGVQDLIGLERFTNYGIKTDKAEIVFFAVEPTNISVLSSANIEIKVHDLTIVLSMIPDLEIIAMDSAERFDGNKWYVKERLQKEENPAVRELLQADHVFLDEIQHVKNYEKTVDSLLARGGFDIYITGSTSELLSSELATLLTGRYVEINILPLSFSEYVWGSAVTAENQRRLFMDYLTFGGLPGARMFVKGSAAQREYVESVFKAILEKDVLKRGGKGRGTVERIIRYMTAMVGNLTSPKRLTDRLAAEREMQHARQEAYNTIQSYLQRLTDCFFMYKAERFDVVGGEHLKQINKYYLTDFGFSHYILHNPTMELQQLVENVKLSMQRHHRAQIIVGQ
jgi:predicted AAA+ superfamily ATPase